MGLVDHWFFHPHLLQVHSRKTKDLKVGTGEKQRLFQEAILCWITDQLRDYPWRKPGRSPYEILIAEILLKRTTATAAARVYEDFLHKFPSPQAINDADEEELTHVLSKVGLQRQRARTVKALAGHLTEVQGGEIPSDLHLLLGIPGLGEYSARAILSFGFGIPAAVVDANIERILSCTFQNALPRRPSQHSLQVLADSLLPNKSHREYNLGLLDLGASICRYTDPLCEECPLTLICDYYNQNKGRLIKEAPGRYETAIGIELRKLRVEKGVGLAKLARLSGVSKLTVIHIESGKTSPKPETVDKLAAALEVAPDQLR